MPTALARLPRVAAVVGAVGIGAAALTGCEAPAPGVSIVSGTSSAWAEATCWSFTLRAQRASRTCAEDIVAKSQTGQSAPSVPAVPGQVVGISVDPAVATRGWFIIIGNQRINQTPITSTYYRFVFPPSFPQEALPPRGITVQVVSVGDGSQPSGLWLFRLTDGVFATSST